MNELQFEKIQMTTGRVIDVFEELETQTMWYQQQKDMYIIFHQDVKPSQQFCYWYNGEVATIILQGKLMIKLHALRTFFSDNFKTDKNLRFAIQKNEFPIKNPTWQIDVYTMKGCTGLDYKIKQSLFNVNCYKDKLKGSFELSSYDFKGALHEIYNDINILEINN